jgi:bacterioferritin (cytochrome b1)
MYAYLNVAGINRLTLAPLFEKEMRSELGHVLEFSEKVVALGGVPTMESNPLTELFEKFKITTDGYYHSFLLAAVAIEREVLKLYHENYPFASAYGNESGDMSIALLLEENIEHTTKDVEELEKLLPVTK